MNNLIKISAVGTVSVFLSVVAANADAFSDSVGDLNNGTGGGADLSGFTHLDITSVDVTSTATDIIFKISLNGDILATDWGKYMIGIDSVAGGDPTGNGWGRPISMSSGMDYFIGSWVDSGNGAEVRSWDGSQWNLDLASYNAAPFDMPVPTTTQFSVTITAPLASLGLSAGNTFDFDVYSSGGGGTDSAIDALANPNVSVLDWSGPYDSITPNLRQYTVVVPEPAAMALCGLGLATLLVLRRRNA